MSEVKPSDILLRVSPKLLEKYQSLCVAGAGRGRVAPLPFTFARADASTCATHIDRDGIVRTAAANVPRIEFVDLDADGIRETPGLLLEGSRVNVVLHNRDLTNAAWTKTNVSAVKDQTGVDGVASSASRITASAGNGTCLQSVTLASSQRLQSCYIKRLVGSGNIDMTTDNGSTWTTVTVTSSWTRVKIPAQTLANPILGFRIVTNADSVAIDYVQNETGAFESSVIAVTTTAVTRAGDLLTAPVNFGPVPLTALSRIARPAHADVAGSLGSLNPGIFDLGNQSTKHLWHFFDATARNNIVAVEAGGSASSTASLPAGAALTYAAQMDIETATGKAKVRQDLGSGYGSFSSLTSTALSSWQTQVLLVGKIFNTNSELFGVLLDLIVARGLFSKAEMEAVP